MTTEFDPARMIRRKREISGISAILLPFTEAGEADWAGLAGHIRRTAEAGLTPAVNMDTGFVNLISQVQRQRVLDVASETLGGGGFVAGAYVADEPGQAFDAAAYLRQIEAIQRRGGKPIIFQSFGLTAGGGDDILARYDRLGDATDGFLAFELGKMFAPFGKIYDLATFRGLLAIKRCHGAKHSSLDRLLEWRRLQARDSVRPDFKLYTGNDLAIDMVIYGSDYLLGLSTFAPDMFARRDAFWLQGDPRFHALNDLLQYLGFLAFRPPVPAYKHSAAQFLKLRGWIDTDATHQNSPCRPESDIPILDDILRRLQAFEAA